MLARSVASQDDSKLISRQPYVPLLLVHVQEERAKHDARTIYPSSIPSNRRFPVVKTISGYGR